MGWLPFEISSSRWQPRTIQFAQRLQNPGLWFREQVWSPRPWVVWAPPPLQNGWIWFPSSSAAQELDRDQRAVKRVVQCQIFWVLIKVQEALGWRWEENRSSQERFRKDDQSITWAKQRQTLGLKSERVFLQEKIQAHSRRPSGRIGSDRRLRKG